MKNPFENLFLSKEVKEALIQSREAVNHAMEAKTTLDAIYVTERLASMFGKNPDNLAETLKEDYYTELLVAKMLKDKQEETEEELVTA